MYLKKNLRPIIIKHIISKPLYFDTSFDCGGSFFFFRLLQLPRHKSVQYDACCRKKTFVYVPPVAKKTQLLFPFLHVLDMEKFMSSQAFPEHLEKESALIY